MWNYSGRGVHEISLTLQSNEKFYCNMIFYLKSDHFTLEITKSKILYPFDVKL